MAIGWLTLLKAVPWVDVARKAPEIAESAKKLWHAVAKKSANSEIEVQTAPVGFATEEQEIIWLKQRLSAIEVANSDLHNQMLASTELMKALAEQNTQLIKRVDLNRKRIVGLTLLTVVIAVCCIVSIFSK